MVTRPREQAVALAGLIESAGGQALRYPAIEIAVPENRSRLFGILDGLARFEMAIFISPTAVQEAFKLIRERTAWPMHLRAVAVGPGTRRELERHGLSSVLAPASGADSEALLAMPELARLAGRRVVIFRGAGGRKLLGESLVERGADVTYAECYRRRSPKTDFGRLAGEWEKGVDAVTVYSAGALANLFDMLPEPCRPRLGSTPLFVAHARIAQEAARRGARSVRVAGPGDEEMLAALVAYFLDAK